MPHTIHKTESIILGGVNSKESDRYVSLFTKELGLIYGLVIGLRELKGKLRYNLQDFSHTDVELVYGKSGWRVTNASHTKNFASLLMTGGKRGELAALGRITSLLKRLLPGEEQNELLFVHVRDAFETFVRMSLSSDEVLLLEAQTVMKVLNDLGYWGDENGFTPFLEGDIEDRAFRDAFKLKRLAVIRAINESLKATQL